MPVRNAIELLFSDRFYVINGLFTSQSHFFLQLVEKKMILKHNTRTDKIFIIVKFRN